MIHRVCRIIQELFIDLVQTFLSFWQIVFTDFWAFAFGRTFQLYHCLPWSLRRAIGGGWYGMMVWYLLDGLLSVNINININNINNTNYEGFLGLGDTCLPRQFSSPHIMTTTPPPHQLMAIANHSYLWQGGRWAVS
jgi:hypothetical protein